MRGVPGTCPQLGAAAIRLPHLAAVGKPRYMGIRDYQVPRGTPGSRMVPASRADVPVAARTLVAVFVTMKQHTVVKHTDGTYNR